MFEHSIIKTTGQWWKVLLSCAAVLSGGALLLWAVIQLQDRDASSAASAFIVSGMLLGCFGLLFACTAIYCPKCKARWVWRGIKGQEAGQWLGWLLRHSKCPVCKAP